MGSKYLCLECGEIYDSDWLNNNELFEYIQCPKTNCIGTLIEVDELLLPTIRRSIYQIHINKFKNLIF